MRAPHGQPGNAWPAGLRIYLWEPLAVALPMVMLAVLGLAARLPWIFTSFGATGYLLAVNPRHPTSRLWNVIVGHLHGLGAGVLALLITGGWNDPPVFPGYLVLPHRLWAAPLAVLLSAILGALLRAHHPPANSTALVVVLGEIHQGWQVLVFLAGLGILAISGEVVRWISVGKVEVGITPEPHPRNPPGT